MFVFVYDFINSEFCHLHTNINFRRFFRNCSLSFLPRCYRTLIWNLNFCFVRGKIFGKICTRFYFCVEMKSKLSLQSIICEFSSCGCNCLSLHLKIKITCYIISFSIPCSCYCRVSCKFKNIL